MLSTLFQFQYDADSNASEITYTGPAVATVTRSFDVCALPIPPGLGKAARRRWPSCSACWVVAAIPSGVSNDAIEALADQIKDVVVGKIQDLADGLSLPSNVCVPEWEPTLYINANHSGPSVTYGVTDQGFPTPVVVTSSNATAQ